ncbi:MAG: hypothetical protein ABJB34_11090 [Acidobacteriota bacterium]
MGRTIADLQAKIRARTLRPEVVRGRIGIKIVSLNTGKIIFEFTSFIEVNMIFKIFYPRLFTKDF